MRRWLHILLLPLALCANANPILVPEVSQKQVEIIYSFTGAEILLFGAILYPDGRIPSEQADIVVVLRGPSQPIVVREKSKLGGLIWVNASSTKFRSAPGFYAVASSKPLSKLIDERTSAIYELGLDNLHLSPANGDSAEVQRRFEKGLIGNRQKLDLFYESQVPIQITQGSLYQARLHLPARVPVGTFTAETFLVHKGKVLAAATRDIEIRKSGFERFIAEKAHSWPFTYGMTAIALSLLLGWGAAALFKRF